MANIPTAGAPAVQTMASRALLQLSAQQAFQDFSALPPGAQATVFKGLLSQLHSFRQMPLVDRHLVVDRPHRDVPGPSAFEGAQAFRKSWSFGGPADYTEDFPHQRGTLHWNSDDMDFSRSNKDQPFRYIPESERQERYKGSHDCSLHFRNAISSPLLFYRLRAAFGPWDDSDLGIDGDQSGREWQLCLLYTPSLRQADEGSHPSGRLHFYDYRGKCYVYFDGTVEVSDKAVELVNYLLSDDTYSVFEKPRRRSREWRQAYLVAGSQLRVRDTALFAHCFGIMFNGLLVKLSDLSL
ncbi:uncharacterized protein AB675_8181 [Cyphellophora attinorum]|uniref:Uncharacterized protein n=1 Tax=Cyphellophora attinorum TaxID=1664694 RepID=A0A0N1HRY2_9EURO|nr:uncharacterized protein AB675_8181 [Phialophora attinorum]KPI41214.1 hypothetical protein AB675_8181 [Phialophora attinorum]